MSEVKKEHIPVPEMRKAHIHHKDGDPTNNPQDGSNWEVLCSKCHQAEPKDRKNGSGVYTVTLFAPWKRAEILKSRGYLCEGCGAILKRGRYSNKAREKCMSCGLILERQKDKVYWQSGQVMCKICFEGL